MLKGIKLRLNSSVGPSAGTGGEVIENLKQAFAAAGHGLSLDAQGLTVDEAGNLSGTVYVSGEQEAPVDFKALAVGAVTDAIQSVRGPQPPAAAAAAAAADDKSDIEVVKNEDEDEDLIAPPPLPGAPAPAPPPTEPRPRTKKRLFEDEEAMPSVTSPKVDALEDCPLGGDGGDHLLNELKNRTHSGNWKDVSVEDLLDLDWPEEVENRKREKWLTEAMKEVLANEKKGAIRIRGWLAAAKKEGEESCNCHSPTAVDYHLWIVDDPAKANKENRWQSVVCETTPRVSVQHDGGWAGARMSKVIKSFTEVRLSGWLMLDQEHPEQLQKTRGTLWEIHPIIEFEIKQNGQWVALEEAEL